MIQDRDFHFEYAMPPACLPETPCEAYFMTIGGGVVGAVAAGESENVSHAFQPEGRAAASNSP